MKKVLSIVLSGALMLSVSSCAAKTDNKVIIYSSSEENRNEYILKELNKQFPDYKIDLQYLSTGNNAAKLKAEGKNTACDIVLGLEDTYLKQNEGILADISSHDTSVYLEDTLSKNNKYLPWERGAGCIAIRKDLLKEKSLSMPTSYQDLLKEEYKGFISMPSPKASGTGYAFVKSLINAWGEEEALKYFEKLAVNITQFTSSGSGPVNALVQGEAVIALGMTFQAVSEINNGVDLEIVYFEEGSPNTICGVAVIDGKQDKPAVKAVFDYLNSTLVYQDKELFVPEQIFKTQNNTIPNYPQNIKYSDMTSDDAVSEKTHILEIWPVA